MQVHEQQDTEDSPLPSVEGIAVGKHSASPAANDAEPTSPRWVKAVSSALLIALAATVVGAAALVYVFHPRFDTVLTGSMRPGVQPGDVVMVRAVPNEELRVGDVIAYLPPGRDIPVLHRIVELDETGAILTQGDANNVADPWGAVHPEDATTLRLVWVIPKIGLIAHNRTAILTGAGALLLAALALAILTHRREQKPAGPYEDPATPTER